ncbi:hypothetical protein PQQ53_23295 [Paraburkholderia strydomiana]|uniref:hypothetical protein n=1 Tax=Paraburkholderia strydomiana TaxID=1245417 RepID=UPI0038B80032
MHTIKSRNRTAELLSFLVFLAGIAAAAITLAVIARTYLPLFSSDYEQVFFRAAQLKHGEISVADFVFRRQVDHPHFIVFGLAYLDAMFLGGRAWLLYAASFAFCSATIATISVSIFRSERDRATRFALMGLAIFLLLGPQNIGILEWPFQVTLVGTASLITVASYLLTRDQTVSKSFLAGLLLAVAIISHGAGVLAIPVLIALALIVRRKSLVVIAVLLTIEFSVYAAHYPATPHIHLAAILAKMIHAPSAWIGIPAYVSYLLGHGVAFGVLSAAADAILGAVGLCAYLFSIVRFVRFKQGSAHLAFISTFGLLACLTSVTLNIAYEDLRNVNVNFSYFFAVRYLPWTALFWIGTFANSISAARSVRVAAPTISAVAAVFLAIGSIPAIQRTNADFSSRVAIIDNFGCLEKVSACVLSRAVSLPVDSVRPWSARVFGWQREVGVSNLPSENACVGGAQTKFAPDSILEHVISVQPADFSDVNWSRGISRTRAGFFVSNASVVADLKPCDVVKLADGTVRGIVEIDGRNVYVEGGLLPASAGYPAMIGVIQH